MLRSPDRGVTWSKKPVIVRRSRCTYGGAHDPDTGPLIRSGGLPDFAVDGKNAYMVWEDALPSAPTTGRIIFSQSTDGGLTWSSPDRDQPDAGDASMRSSHVAVNSTGTVGVSYYDFRNTRPPTGSRRPTCGSPVLGDRAGTRRSWLSETRVTPASFDMRAGTGGARTVHRRLHGHDDERRDFEPFFMQSGTPPVADGPTDAFFASVP